MNQTVITKDLTGFYDWENDGSHKFRWIGRSAEMEVALFGNSNKNSIGIATMHVGAPQENKIRILDGPTILYESDLAQGWQTVRFEFDLASPRLLKFEVDSVFRNGSRTQGVQLGKLSWVAIQNHQFCFNQPEILLDKGGVFEILFSKAVMGTGGYLVIDIYDLDKPVHPEGHLGWWQFPVDSLFMNAKGNVSLKGGKIGLTLENCTPSHSWINELKISFERLVVNAVLRDSITNAIIYLDKIPAFKNIKDLAIFRESFNIDWNVPKYATPGYVLSKECTIRLVSPNIYPGDAVGNLCLEIYRMLRQNNIAVEMYAENYDLTINNIVRRINRLKSDSSVADRLLYFCSTFDPFLEEILALPMDSRVAYFHGITKPELLQVFDTELSVTCKKGLKQIKSLQEFDVLSANSYASALVMLDKFDSESGWKEEDIHIIPPSLLPSNSIHKTKIIDTNNPTRLLYVGRIKSHKKIEHLLELFSTYLELDPEAELWIVGAAADKAYWDYLNWLETSQLKIPENKVRWIGTVNDVELSNRYATASLYVSMSEDEGFCLPVLEAMLAGLPVFVHGLPAIRELLQGTGIYFMEKNFHHLAARIYELLHNTGKLESVVTRQKERALKIAMDMNGQRFLDLLQPMLDSSMT